MRQLSLKIARYVSMIAFAVLMTACPGVEFIHPPQTSGYTGGGTSGETSTSGTSTTGEGTQGTSSTGAGTTTSGGTTAGQSATGTTGQTTSGAGTRAYDKMPDTSQGNVAVYAISDQPASSIPTDAVARFAASHFAGTEKMTAQAKAKFVAYNPNWIQLHYRLGAASGPASFIHDNSWGNWPGTEWPALLSAHPEYFLRDANGNLDSYDGTDHWYAHDLTNANMRAWWIQQTIGDMRASDSDMTFGDSFNGVIGCAMTHSSDGGICDPRLSGTGAITAANWANGYTYAQQLNDWMVEIQNAFHAEPGEPLFIPNLGALNTEWFFDHYDFAHADGAFLESFPEANENAYDYNAAGNYALQLTGADKVVIIQPYIDPNDTDERLFCVGTYLLIKGKRTFLNMMGGNSSTGFYYWPEYTVALGPPLSPPPATMSALQSGSVLRRAFQHGYVMVNASGNTVSATVPTGKTYYRITPVGGGGVNTSSIDSNGNLTSGFMSLTSQQVSGSISLNPWSGAILLDKP